MEQMGQYGAHSMYGGQYAYGMPMTMPMMGMPNMPMPYNVSSKGDGVRDHQLILYFSLIQVVTTRLHNNKQ